MGNIGLERANTFSTAFDSGVVTDNTVLTYSNLLYPHILDNGGNDQIVSLTIDVLNKDQLVDSTENLPNKALVTEERMRNDLSLSADIWGFKEAFHGTKKSKSIANGFCFGGQELTFYIAPEGHGSGQIDGEWIYCKTTVTVSATDLVNGTNELLHTFDDFESGADDDSRRFTWSVPEQSSTLFSSYGLFGLVVIRLNVERTYYEDADWKTSIEEVAPSSNQAHLQLLIYSGAREIIDVDAGDISILTSTPAASDSLTDIFSDTVLETLQDANLNPLSDAQKRAIIADQIALLFMSQHPIINADFYPSKVIGGGAKAAVEPRKVLDQAITYLQTYPDLVAMVDDRLFGMFVTYQAFNFTDEMESFIPDKTQSTQSVRDPVRVILMQEDGTVADDLGVDGVAFDPYALDVLNAEFTSYAPSDLVIDMPLYDGTVDIDNLSITGPSGSDLEPYDRRVQVSFDVVYGESNIKQIRYSLFTLDGLNYVTDVDTTGNTRLHVFVLPIDRPIVLYQVPMETF
jgi:hypothetical protein